MRVYAIHEENIINGGLMWISGIFNRISRTFLAVASCCPLGFLHKFNFPVSRLSSVRGTQTTIKFFILCVHTTSKMYKKLNFLLISFLAARSMTAVWQRGKVKLIAQHLTWFYCYVIFELYCRLLPLHIIIHPCRYHRKSIFFSFFYNFCSLKRLR